MSTPATKAVKAKATKKTKAATKTATPIKIVNETVVTYKSPRPAGLEGPKTVLLGCVPKKGSIKYGDLKVKAVEAGLNPEMIQQYLSVMARNGRVELS